MGLALQQFCRFMNGKKGDRQDLGLHLPAIPLSTRFSWPMASGISRVALLDIYILDGDMATATSTACLTGTRCSSLKPAVVMSSDCVCTCGVEETVWEYDLGPSRHPGTDVSPPGRSNRVTGNHQNRKMELFTPLIEREEMSHVEDVRMPQGIACL